jgi:hypothetical protein
MDESQYRPKNNNARKPGPAARGAHSYLSLSYIAYSRNIFIFPRFFFSHVILPSPF